MENILEVRNADQPQTENVSVPVEQPNILSGEAPVNNTGVVEPITNEATPETPT